MATQTSLVAQQVRLQHWAEQSIDPVRLRFCLRIAAKTIYMVDHIPRAIHICISEMITIIPLFRFCQM